MNINFAEKKYAQKEDVERIVQYQEAKEWNFSMKIDMTTKFCTNPNRFNHISFCITCFSVDSNRNRFCWHFCSETSVPSVWAVRSGNDNTAYVTCYTRPQLHQILSAATDIYFV